MTATRNCPTWVSWSAMWARCTNERIPLYKYYGARGITVCPEWASFERFLSDMGERPPETSIDRIDNDKGYNKDNCRWATDMEQAQNTRRNRNIEYNGEIRCITEWARIAGIGEPTLHHRLRVGWSMERAMTTPAIYNANRTLNKYIEYNGERHHLAEWERRFGFTRGLLTDRLRAGWTPERALTTPIETKHRRKPRTIQ